ncbi:hypothetical protein K2173_024877 [Erythroxylum novogranatense]|uniref:Thioredoxin domain-containing protein n=1 Tax=Erythroxylum novogranatense TaxID=1862640 RepID=A0AAV8UFZ9_9ROSI|nr:hypothetical protein K2173_024877 [Erythroxylum novogranatense]
MGSIFSFLFGGGNSAVADEYASDGISGVTAFHSLMVDDLAASWCEPCKLMKPVVHAMAAKFTDVHSAMPTFVLVKRGKELDSVVGAKKDELEKKAARHEAWRSTNSIIIKF